jgi:phage terminase small subunit
MLFGMAKDKQTQLTPKQEKFCQVYVDSGIASYAYRQAYNTEKMKPETVWQSASKLLNDRKVTARVNEIRAERAEETKVDRARCEEELMAIATASVTDIFEYNEEKGRTVLKDPISFKQSTKKALKKVSNKRGEVSYEFHSKTDAIAKLAAMNGWDAARKVEVGGKLETNNNIVFGNEVFDDD